MWVLSRFNAALRVAIFLALARTALSGRTLTASKRVRGAALLTAADEKPIRGLTANTSRGSERAFGARLPKDLIIVKDFECGIRYTVVASTNKDKRCPAECPYLAQDKSDNRHCTFQCAKDSAGCKAMNPKTIIPDKERGICRAPMVQSCKMYNDDGTDTCKKCNSLYYVGPDGLCYGKLAWLAYAVGIILGVVVLFLVVWITDLVIRPATNLKVLKEALNFRSFQKLRKSKEEGRDLWPLNTNLLTTVVAGPGMMLHFNFQFWIILWAFAVAIGWMVMAAVVDDALFILGTRKFGTPFTNCVLVAWGFETQQKLMWTKILFVSVVYTVSFLLSLVHSVRQMRMHQVYDYEHQTMKDYAILMENLPPVKGTERLEEQLSECLFKASAHRPIGVSVGWEYEDNEPLIMALVEQDAIRHKEHLLRQTEGLGRGVSMTEAPEPGSLRKQLYKLEDAIFGPGESKDTSEKGILEVLGEVNASPYAFAVFKTQQQRDDVLAKLGESGVDFGGAKLRLLETSMEPETVQWQFLGAATGWTKTVRLFKGFFAIFLALTFWTVVFYLPYAWSVFSFNYDNGQEPGAIYSIAFSMVVVVGNQIMYEVCARVAENVGYRFQDDRNACYMILFTISCLYNVLVDMVTTYFMSEQIMIELGFRTYYGEKLREIGTFTERFESYAMQRTLAENSFRYAFPATFLVPFLIEPLATILIPLKLGIWIVRSHPEIRGRDAEMLVASIPMDMGRYADILLNVMLGILIFYFPGGYTHWLFLGMAGSHAYIYFFDHCRVLRTVPALTIATMDVDWWSQFMLAPCCALILSCLVFKANCQGYGFCFSGFTLIGACTGAFVAHCAIHWLLLIFVVPLFGVKPPVDDKGATVPFKDVAEKIPCSWFTANPVHCLRSAHVYHHTPACTYLFSGKEHLLKKNEKIGCFFEDEEAKPEDFLLVTGERPAHRAWSVPSAFPLGSPSRQ